MDHPSPPARTVTTTIVAAAATFAPSSYARARLIRQLHAGGLLSDARARDTQLAAASRTPC